MTGKILSDARMIFSGIAMIFPFAGKISPLATKILFNVSMIFFISDRLVPIREDISSLFQKIFGRTQPMLSAPEKTFGREQMIFCATR